MFLFSLNASYCFQQIVLLTFLEQGGAHICTPYQHIIILQNGKTAKDFKSKPGEIEAKILSQLPPGSRTGLSNPYPQFDWSILESSSEDNQKSSQRVNRLIDLPFSSISDDHSSTAQTPDDRTESSMTSDNDNHSDIYSSKEPIMSNLGRRLSAISEFGISMFNSSDTKDELNNSHPTKTKEKIKKHKNNSTVNSEDAEAEDIAFKIQQVGIIYFALSQI